MGSNCLSSWYIAYLLLLLDIHVCVFKHDITNGTNSADPDQCTPQ